MRKIVLTFDVRISRHELINNPDGVAIWIPMASFGGELVPDSIRVELVADDKGPAAGD